MPPVINSFPWGEVIAILVFLSAIVMILVRNGLRKPPDLATVDEVKSLSEDFKRLEHVVVEWEKEYRAECASLKDVDGLGQKIAKVESFYLTVHDNGIKALNRAGRALREVRQNQKELEEFNGAFERLEGRLGPLPERLARIEENLNFISNQLKNRG